MEWNKRPLVLSVQKKREKKRGDLVKYKEAWHICLYL